MKSPHFLQFPNHPLPHLSLPLLRPCFKHRPKTEDLWDRRFGNVPHRQNEGSAVVQGHRRLYELGVGQGLKKDLSLKGYEARGWLVFLGGQREKKWEKKRLKSPVYCVWKSVSLDSQVITLYCHILRHWWTFLILPPNWTEKFLQSKSPKVPTMQGTLHALTTFSTCCFSWPLSLRPSFWTKLACNYISRYCKTSNLTSKILVVIMSL